MHELEVVKAASDETTRLDLGLSTKESTREEQMKSPIIIMFCEYSEKRGPRMITKFRNLDRKKNEFPLLNIPDLYLLEGGYKNFSETYPVSY